MPNQRYKLTIAYDGSDFYGWQKQEPPDGQPLRTVQGVVEAALRREVYKQPVVLVGASRTDTGVHALGQVAHVDADTPIPLERMPHAINSRLPQDVEVREVETVDDRFGAIKGAVNKQYRYRIYNRSQRPLGIRHLVYHCWWPLDVDRMNDGAQRLVGTHDCEGLSAASHGRTTTVRTIYACHVERHDDEIHIVVQGSGFLYNMVRIIAGTLVEVGRGQFESSRIDQILETADRSLAGPTLPPGGLCLEWIRYGEGEGSPESGVS